MKADSSCDDVQNAKIHQLGRVAGNLASLGKNLRWAYIEQQGRFKVSVERVVMSPSFGDGGLPRAPCHTTPI